MLVTILNVLIAGLLTGGIYALVAMGLSLQYGVAKVLNVAHGEFIMLAAFLTWLLFSAAGINPLLSLAICGPIMFIIGFIIYRTLFTKLRNSSPSPAAFEGTSMLAAFGLLFIIQNIALSIWGGAMRGYSYLNVGVHFLGASFAANRLAALVVAIVASSVFYVILFRTRIGKAIRAAAEDPATAELMGVNINQVLSLCFGFGALLAGFAGVLVSMCYPIYGTIGLEYTIIAIIVVTLGGLGSITGSLV
jgi:branched-chain amino acid transport system permease protein